MTEVDAALAGSLSIEQVTTALSTVTVSRGSDGENYGDLLCTDDSVETYAYDMACGLTLTTDVATSDFESIQEAIATVWSAQDGRNKGCNIRTVFSGIGISTIKISWPLVLFCKWNSYTGKTT